MSASSARLLASSRRRFAAAEEGLAAVEFALILPIMVVFYFGLVGLTVGVMQDRKVTLVSRTVADLAGRLQGSANTAEIDTIVGAAGNVLAPYDPNGIVITVASVAVRGTGQMENGRERVTATICWSSARSITKVNGDFVTSQAAVPGQWAKGKPYPGTLPGGFDTPNSSFIQTAVEQEYKPVIGKELLRYVTSPPVDSIKLEDQMPWPVRNVREIPWEGQQPCLPAS